MTTELKKSVRFLLLFSIVLLHIQCIAQTDEQILKVSDSIVLKGTSQEYFNTLKYPTHITKSRTRLFGDTVSELRFSIIYYYPYLSVIKKNGWQGSAGSHITLNNDLSLDRSSNFELDLKAFNKHRKSNIISQKEAENTASQYFSEKAKKKYYTYLVYSEEQDKLFWVVVRKYGFRYKVEENIFINAEGSTYFKKTETKYFYTFWQAIKYWFRGY